MYKRRKRRNRLPELPEVETVRRTLKRLVIGKTIDQVTVHLPRIIQEPADITEFSTLLRDETIRDIGRKGKYLLFAFDHWVLVSHLRMEGRYSVVPQNEPMEKHTHVVFHFTDESELRYRDVRQFGTMELVRPEEVYTKTSVGKLGPEPLSAEFTKQWLREQLAHRKTRLKSLLLNQEFLAGLGNIYVDEALFIAGLHPERSASDLSRQDVDRLHGAIQSTIEQAIAAGGASVRSYVNGEGEMGMFQLQINVYGRAGEPCPNCGRPIQRIVVAGRGTHVCEHCQKRSTAKTR